MADVNLSAIRGDSKTFNFTLSDCSGAPINLSGSDITMTVRYGSFIALQKNVINHIVPESGITYIEFSGDDWLNFPNGNFDYDLQLKDQYQQITTVMKGKIFVEEDFTY